MDDRMNTTGITTASVSCSGTCLTLGSVHRLNISEAETALGRGGLVRTDRALRQSLLSAGVVVVAVMLLAPR
jgi:hypothetical protein